MSLYLGRTKVSTSHAVVPNDKTVITNEQVEELSKSAFTRTGFNNSKTISSIINSLNKKWWINREHQIEIGDNNIIWTRPEGWPDLDSLNLSMSGDDYIYMTYDNTRGRAGIALHVEKVNNGANIEVVLGHIINGTYVVDETIVGSNNNYVRWLTNEDYDYPVVRVTGDIKYCYSYNVTNNGATQTNRQQPIIERIAWVPHIISLAGSGAWGSYLLERDKVANGNGSTLTSLYSAWSYCYNLYDLDISELYTPNCTNMDSTFTRLGKITSLDLRHFDVSKVTTFSSIFNTCRHLRTLDLRGWNTAKVTNFNYMFVDCRSLNDLRGAWDFNTSSATTMIQMFQNCWSLSEIHPENYVINKVTTLNSFFTGCYQITSLDLSKWRPEKVINFGGMFSDCWNLKYINFNGWSTTGVITTVASMFAQCRSLTNIDISWLHLTSACTSIGSMFNGCYSLTKIDIPNDWDVSGISSGNYTAYQFFQNCYSLKTITGIANWNFQFTNSLSSMFSGCWSLETVDVSNWNVSTVTSLSGMFYNCWSLKTIDISKWRATNTTNLANMFDYCYSLENIDISNLNPGQFTTMSAMFRYCINLTSIGDISRWDTSKCTNFANAFQDCHSLSSLPDISNWDFSAATTTVSMFQGLFSIKEIILDNINLPECTNISGMFSYCYNLKKVHMTGWNIPKVTATSAGAFLGYCISLVDVVISIPFIVNHSFYYDDSLSHESCLNILNNLPTVTTRRTLALMNSNINRLTAAEKQIATDKNWTLSNS